MEPGFVNYYQSQGGAEGRDCLRRDTILCHDPHATVIASLIRVPLGSTLCTEVCASIISFRGFNFLTFLQGLCFPRAR